MHTACGQQGPTKQEPRDSVPSETEAGRAQLSGLFVVLNDRHLGPAVSWPASAYRERSRGVWSQKPAQRDSK